jgi:hypothetical protein
MALQDYEQFRGVNHIRRDHFNQNVLLSFIDWLKWSTLQVGGFQNISSSFGSGIFGGDFSRLRLADDPNYTSGQVWEGFRSDWVWETGIEYDVSPTFCSGVSVGNTFYPTASTTGTYEHTVNFPLGRVVFSSAITTNSLVTTSFSHRTISYTRASETWFQEILYDSWRIDRDDYLIQGSGQWDQLARNRRVMPVVGVELANRRFEPYEMGTLRNWVYQDVVMYVLAESEEDRNQIVDILSQQHDKTIWTYNRGLMKENATYPVDLDMNGSPVASPMQFPQLVAATGDGGFRYQKVAIGDMRVTQMEHQNGVYRGVLRSTFQGVL